MITYEEFTMIHTLYKQGYSMRAISRMTGIDRRTISKRLKENKYKPREKVLHKSKLDPFKEYIKERIVSGLPERIPSTVIFQEILEMGYEGKIRILQSYMSKLYNNFLEFKEEKLIRFETSPGEQAQVDWTLIKGGKNKIYAFVMILGYSRYAYVHFTGDMKYETFEACHLKSFEFFGGIPKTILYDNLKSVVIKRNAYGASCHKFNEKFLEFSKEYNFTPILCKPYRAKTKGKVERFIGYLKRNFYIPLKAKLKNSSLKIDIDLLNTQIFRWLEVVSNRIHGTHKSKPKELFMKERELLLPLLPKRYFQSDLKHHRIKNKILSIDVKSYSKLNDYEILLQGACNG
ncbi:IS21 family transposase [Methanocaldococcus sp.]